jgi:hypothetical protein
MTDRLLRKKSRGILEKGSVVPYNDIKASTDPFLFAKNAWGDGFSFRFVIG